MCYKDIGLSCSRISLLKGYKLKSYKHLEAKGKKGGLIKNKVEGIKNFQKVKSYIIKGNKIGC